MERLKRIKGLIIGVIVICMIFSHTAIQAQTNKTILYYDGIEHPYVNTDIKISVEGDTVDYAGMFPVVIDGRTLVPVREVLESASIDAKVSWDSDTQMVRIQKNNEAIQLYIDKDTAVINGDNVALDVAPKLIRLEGEKSPKTMVPLRFIAEAFDYTVDWNQESQTVELEKRDYEDYTDDAVNDTTTLSSVTYYKYKDQYVIQSEDAMSGINYFMWNDKLIIDIDNADIGQVDQVIDVYKNTYVNNVRSSQFSNDPLSARIVFDLKPGVEPTYVKISEDRKEISVVFGSDALNGIQVVNQGTEDKVIIDGDYSDIHISRLENPERIIIDLENAISPYKNMEATLDNGAFVETYRIAKFDETTTRIVLETNGKAAYALTPKTDNESTVVTLSSDSGQEDKEDNNNADADADKDTNTGDDKEDVKPDKDQTTDLTDYEAFMTVAMSKEEYYEPDISYDHKTKEVILHFPDQMDMSFVDDLDINREAIEELTRVGHVLSLRMNHIYETKMTLDNGKMHLMGIRPRYLYDTIVVIDPGHGGYKPGTGHAGLVEKNINLALGQHLYEYTKGSSVKYYFTRMIDEHIGLQERCEIANDLQADLFVSLHINAMDVDKNPSLSAVNGFEVHITDNTEQSDTEEAFAEGVVEQIRSDVGFYNAFKIKVSNELVVLKHTLMPSVLIEYGFLTNDRDAAFLSDDDNLDALARGTYNYIEAYFKE